MRAKRSRRSRGRELTFATQYWNDEVIDIFEAAACFRCLIYPRRRVAVPMIEDRYAEQD